MPSVLVVDDDADTRHMLRAVLEDAGYVVCVAPDGQPALERLQTSHERLVAPLDLRMPGINGQQVIEAVAAQHTLATRHAYILMTANPATLPLSFVTQLRSLRMPVLAKPFDLDTLLRVVVDASSRVHASMS
ncbi:MAG TPA: response regulator [Ktedonobacterales bacterium]|nr:response regulator [Ktedonobacterales bacterium]